MKEYLSVNGLWDIVGGTEKEPLVASEKARFFQNQKDRTQTHHSACFSITAECRTSRELPQEEMG